MIERISGGSYARFVRERLFDPLKMRDSGDLTEDGVIAGLATGYNPGFPPSRLQHPVYVNPDWLVGSGSIYSTAHDLFLFAEAIHQRRPVDLAARTYPYGWGVRQVFGRRLWEQNGRIPLGYTSYLGLYPDDDLVVVVLSSVQVDIVEKLGRDLAAMTLGEAYATPARHKIVNVLPQSLASYAGRYLIAPGVLMTVRAQRDRLSLAGPEGDFMPLEPESERQFYFPALDTVVTFSADSSGRVTGLNWGGKFKAQRVE